MIYNMALELDSESPLLDFWFFEALFFVMMNIGLNHSCYLTWHNGSYSMQLDHKNYFPIYHPDAL